MKNFGINFPNPKSSHNSVFTDPSSLWQTWTDLCLNSNAYVSVYALTYDSCSNKIYAGGNYSSTANDGRFEPFIVSYDSSNNTYSEPSEIWNSPNWTDLCLNFDNFGFGFGSNGVFALTYDSCNNKIYAGGNYSSTFNSGLLKPFFISYDPITNIYSDPSALIHIFHY